ncbi:hypothetical protein A3C59_05045 [Candidatus Daviesbacteria bacterium RIFCSPHIGHO2_02_FULL_36_13]|uniref:DNA polymerase IV n=1 Tax=Candidatus Daviesbacteria bacterium RIFCSPHIGHO2_02_FULL_36_13 TaxID=1797768 RepID=A0A1F5JY48_9BACT|nr:MAG: hypothetical protein A3C59_05045 [Candidatus Daviesbacteria bacterium RIFCSPHIGHO2_02_FULL_36_13]
MRTILHIDFNSFFATVEQQANPRLRGKPIGVTGGDRMERTVIGAASIEAKHFGVKTGMHLYDAKRLCPEIILVRGDSDKYLEVTKKFLNIIKDYSPYVEMFSIDEVFIELKNAAVGNSALGVALIIKNRIREEIGEWMRVSIGISYNKLMAKLASNLQKPDGLVVISNQKQAIQILDQIELNEICGIGLRIKKRLNNMGVFSFKDLRLVPLKALLASFKSYGQTLYNMSRGIDNRPILPFFEKEEVKSIGHRHTLSHDTNDQEEIKQLLLKLTELVARRLRAKKLVGRTVSVWYRNSLKVDGGFTGDGMQMTMPYTSDGIEIFRASWKIFHSIWTGDKIRMVGVSISNLKPQNPQNLSLLPETIREEVIIEALDKINDKFGEFTLQRGTLLGTSKMKRMPNPFLSDRRFKL